MPIEGRYTQPKARRIRKLAANPAYMDENGKPDLARIAREQQVTVDVCRFILHGPKAQTQPKKTKAKPKAEALDE